MSLQPKSTHWFETYVPRAQTVYALEALAATGRVELEQEYTPTPLRDTDALRSAILEAERLSARYAELLPEPLPTRRRPIENPLGSADTALEQLRSSLSALLRLRRKRRNYRRALRNLRRLHECVAAMGDSSELLLGIGCYSEFLGKRILACPLDRKLPAGEKMPGASARFTGTSHRFLVVASLPEEISACDEAARRSGCERIRIPDDLPADWSAWPAEIDARINTLLRRIRGVDRARARLKRETDLADAIERMNVLRWYLEHTVALSKDGRHCHVTGWTSSDDPHTLQRALLNAGIEATLVFRPPPVDRSPPVDTPTRGQGAPFRLFVDMLGTPGINEFDPSNLLSVLVPLLFGLMFPDVGHGLILALFAGLLADRHPRLRFLVPCGLAAAGFGLLFGETFGSDELLPALWVVPLDQPLVILFGSLVLGAIIILLGLALSGIEAHWRGELSRWLWQEGAVLVIYVSALAALLEPRALVLTGLGLLWYLSGVAQFGRGAGWRRLVWGMGRLLQSALELTLNTLSFIRVGAFALAHSALSHAVVDIADSIDGDVGRWVFLVVGHGLLIAVEGLVVFIQTTRLILFEFFTRFLRAEGRLFRPVDAPGDRDTQPRRHDDRR